MPDEEVGHSQILREISNLDTRLNERINSVQETARAIHDDYTRVPTLLDRAILLIREIMEAQIDKQGAIALEKFARVETQFVELDKRSGQLKIAGDTAIAAAMAAAEKGVSENNRSFAQAVLKSETSTGEALKNLENLFKTEIRSTNEMVSIIRSKQDKGEGIGASVWMMGAAMLAILSLGIAGYSAFRSAAAPQVIYAPAPAPAPTNRP